MSASPACRPAPHLHYEIYRGGVAVNPLSVRFTSAAAVDPGEVGAVQGAAGATARATGASGSSATRNACHLFTTLDRPAGAMLRIRASEREWIMLDKSDRRIVAALLLAAPPRRGRRTRSTRACRSLMACEVGRDRRGARLRCYAHEAAVADRALALNAGRSQWSTSRPGRGRFAGRGRARPAAMGDNRAIGSTLDSGDRSGRSASTSSADAAASGRGQVKLRKGAFGNYWLSDPSSIERRAPYLGRGSLAARA